MRDGGDSAPCLVAIPRLEHEDLRDGHVGRPTKPIELWDCGACGRLHIIRNGKVEYWTRDEDATP